LIRTVNCHYWCNFVYVTYTKASDWSFFQWHNQKQNVRLLLERLLAPEKEMQRQKLLQEQNLLQDVDAVQHQKDLQGEELLAKVLQEELLEDLVHEEGDVNLLSFFFQISK